MSSGFLDAFQANLLSPTVLFFALGVLAAVCRSDLKFPDALYSGLTIYLLAAIGFKGGVSLAVAGLAEAWLPIMAAACLGALIPLWTYPILRFAGRLPAVDAASIAGHYGSVSAVTFIAATNFLSAVGQSYEAYAPALLAVMESPAIVAGVLLGRAAMHRSGGPAAPRPLGSVFHEAVFGRSVVLLLGGLVAGYLSGPKGLASVEGFFVTPFQGALALFLMDLGIVAGKRLADLQRVGPFLLGFGILMPVLHGFVGIMVGSAVGLDLGSATLLAVLAASASYIAAPAAMRLSLPDANPTYSLTASLVITFPFNVTIGIPLYFALANWWYGAMP